MTVNQHSHKGIRIIVADTLLSEAMVQCSATVMWETTLFRASRVGVCKLA